ncbi:MAG: ribosome silencing factor [Acidobacteriota bacterium]
MSTGYSDLANMIAATANDENASNVVILDLRELTVLTDFFVIASGRSSVQVRGIADSIAKVMEQSGEKLLRREGYNEGRWLILDYNGVIVHVFKQEDREFYQIEKLWGDAPVTAVTS